MAAENKLSGLSSFSQTLGVLIGGGLATYQTVQENKTQKEIAKQRATAEAAKEEQQRKLVAQKISLMPFDRENTWKLASWLVAAVATSLVAIAVGKSMKKGA